MRSGRRPTGAPWWRALCGAPGPWHSVRMHERHAKSCTHGLGALSATFAFVVGLMPCAFGTCSGSPIEGDAPALRVMTFNVLHSSIRNPIGPWSERRTRVMRTIREMHPDIACLQEVSDRQLADVARDLPEYRIVPGERSGAATFPRSALLLSAALAIGGFALGVTRRRAGARRLAHRLVRVATGIGAVALALSVALARYVLGDFLDSGERCPILLREGRVACAEDGSFWVSRQPDRPGSTLPGSPTPHIVHWARLTEPRGGRACVVFNTHLGVVPWTARATAEALFAGLGRVSRGEAQILAGDFNATPNGALVRSLTAGGGGRDALHDTWAEAARREGSGGTFHWGMGAPGPRIDYILVRPGERVRSATTKSAPAGSPHASDHDALLVELEI